ETPKEESAATATSTKSVRATIETPKEESAATATSTKSARATAEIPKSINTCRDSDNGIKYEIYGIVIDETGNEHKDSCSDDGKMLTEHLCSNGFWEPETVECSLQIKGTVCKEGKCVKISTEVEKEKIIETKQSCEEDSECSNGYVCDTIATWICVPSLPLPTQPSQPSAQTPQPTDSCANGIQDQDEDGVDCGNICPNECAQIVQTKIEEKIDLCEKTFGIKEGTEICKESKINICNQGEFKITKRCQFGCKEDLSDCKEKEDIKVETAETIAAEQEAKQLTVLAEILPEAIQRPVAEIKINEEPAESAAASVNEEGSCKLTVVEKSFTVEEKQCLDKALEGNEERIKGCVKRIESIAGNIESCADDQVFKALYDCTLKSMPQTKIEMEKCMEEAQILTTIPVETSAVQVEDIPAQEEPEITAPILTTEPVESIPTEASSSAVTLDEFTCTQSQDEQGKVTVKGYWKEDPDQLSTVSDYCAIKEATGSYTTELPECTGDSCVIMKYDCEGEFIMSGAISCFNCNNGVCKSDETKTEEPTQEPTSTESQKQEDLAGNAVTATVEEKQSENPTETSTPAEKESVIEEQSETTSNTISNTAKKTEETPTPILAEELPQQLDACSNSEQDGDESDIDCGGSCSTKCEVNMFCNSDADCATDNCLENFCAEKEETATNETITDEQTTEDDSSFFEDLFSFGDDTATNEEPADDASLPTDGPPLDVPLSDESASANEISDDSTTSETTEEPSAATDTEDTESLEESQSADDIPSVPATEETPEETEEQPSDLAGLATDILESTNKDVTLSNIEGTVRVGYNERKLAKPTEETTLSEGAIILTSADSSAIVTLQEIKLKEEANTQLKVDDIKLPKGKNQGVTAFDLKRGSVTTLSQNENVRLVVTTDNTDVTADGQVKVTYDKNRKVTIVKAIKGSVIVEHKGDDIKLAEGQSREFKGKGFFGNLVDIFSYN
ncbi:hypothetical protein HZA96_03325, partial [Candidatus Woesearchaeota archaeon]|nr:hypothetical protein [Candidatus Woesearchaeota archaeon]